MDIFDYIIVGAGSAGCVLANRLTQDGKSTVCLLEAGPSDWHPYIHIPAGFMRLLDSKSLNWGYQTEPGEWTSGRAISMPRGKTLGGSSSINGHIYNRGRRSDYDDWVKRGNNGWSYLEVLPYYKRSEFRIGDGDDRFRGRDGPLRVTDTDWTHPLCEAFIESAQSLGIPKSDDYNGAIQEGVSYTQRTIHNGRRISCAKAFLDPARSRTNLKIETHAHVTRLLMDWPKVTGLRYRKGGPNGIENELGARKEIIVAGGVFNSPQLLQLSGIGDPDLLMSLGIKIEHALVGVGANLRDHYVPRFTARVKNIDTINQIGQGPRLIGEAAKWLFTRKGVLSLSSTIVYAFWRSDPSITNNDLQLTFMPGSYKMGRQAQLDKFRGMTVASWQQRPESTGYVKAVSTDPFEKPLIQPNYLEHEHDRQVLLAGMKIARRILRAKPMSPYFDGEEFPGDDVQSDDELLAAATERATTSFHPMGTCRMGPHSDKSAVVDDQLRVHGLQGLRVVDASIMPTMPSANLNAATIMIAEKASDMILGRPPLPAAKL